MKKAMALGVLLLGGCLEEFPTRHEGTADQALPGDDLGRPDGAPSADGTPDARPPRDAAPTDLGPPHDSSPPRDFALPEDAAPDVMPDAACVPAPEICNGRDDDCSGRVDRNREGEGVCGDFILEHCRLWLGVALDQVAPHGAVPAEACGAPAEDVDGDVDEGADEGEARYNGYREGSFRCNWTRDDERFRPVITTGTLDARDHLAIAFTCDVEAGGFQAAWIQSHCAVYLGQAPQQAPRDGAETWGRCPAQSRDDDSDQRCLSTGPDGRFQGMPFAAVLQSGDTLAAAFRCRDDADPNRAAVVTASVEVFLGWGFARSSSFDNLGIADGVAAWGECPRRGQDHEGRIRCVGTAGDGRFHVLPILYDRPSGSEQHVLSVMMRPRR